ncbi:hypothetical protein [Halomonas ramblicola]|uniref:hypothetical protein n=1 Tax=Halomonas ramblicola TaxID=747349 RepID=UPI0025B4A193|nr:hypothetical protein [Halomonas ramblicola]MDN3520712.1 hypothetical protein [Halomonas ramblicola]
MEVLKVIASFLTPLVLLAVGILLNKRLEAGKSAISRERGWQEYWASGFVKVANEYNDAATSCVAALSEAAQISTEKLPGWEEEFKSREQEVSSSVWRLRRLQWDLRIYIQFAPQKGDDVIKTEEELFGSISRLLSNKQGDLGHIQSAQFEFNESVRWAHAEILQITPNKRL